MLAVDLHRHPVAEVVRLEHRIADEPAWHLAGIRAANTGRAGPAEALTPARQWTGRVVRLTGA